MVTRTGGREVGIVSGRLPDNPGELACMKLDFVSFDDNNLERRREFVGERDFRIQNCYTSPQGTRNL